MRIRFNNQFRKLTGNGFKIEEITSCNHRLSLNVKDILEDNGCYFFKKNSPGGKLSDRLNKMEYEFDTNKIRVNDLVSHKISSTQAFQCGLEIIKELYEYFSQKSDEKFEIILSYNYEHCFVTFYKIREGINNVMSEDLEGFKMEAILRIET